MKTRKFLWALLPVLTALLLASCGSDDENGMTQTPDTEPTATVKSVPFTVTVNQGGTTRATVDDDLSTLHFASGDKLYVEGENISGVLDLTTGEGAANGTFSGSLVYSGDEPSASLVLSATLVSSEALECGFFTIADGKVIDHTYPATKVCVANGVSSAVNEAVKKYSDLIGNSTFGDKSFSLTQHTAFLNFTLMYTDAESGINATVTFKNGGATICSGSVTVNEDHQVNFVIPVASETTLNGASIALGGLAAKTFGGSTTLSGKVYNVNKTFPTAQIGVQLWAGGPYWANMNVGAINATDYGLFFAWGETTGYSSSENTDHTFTWENYTYGNSDGTKLTKYVQTNKSEYWGGSGEPDNKLTLDLVDDAANANWGGTWRMPTYEEFRTLTNSDYSGRVSGVWTTESGVSGYRFTGTEEGYTDKSIFLPASGYRYGASFSSRSYGYYWSSSLFTNNPNRAYFLLFQSGNAVTSYHYRSSGLSVRPVHD